MEWAPFLTQSRKIIRGTKVKLKISKKEKNKKKQRGKTGKRRNESGTHFLAFPREVLQNKGVHWKKYFLFTTFIFYSLQLLQTFSPFCLEQLPPRYCVSMYLLFPQNTPTPPTLQFGLSFFCWLVETSQSAIIMACGGSEKLKTPLLLELLELSERYSASHAQFDKLYFFFFFLKKKKGGGSRGRGRGVRGRKGGETHPLMQKKKRKI